MTPVWKLNKRTLVRLEKLPAVREIPVAKGLDDWHVILVIRIVVFDKIRSFAGVFGIMNTLDEESPTIEMPSAVTVSGPALLSSTYMPEVIRIAIGFTLDAIPLAVVIALARLA